MAILRNTTITDTGALTLPVGTTAQRPSPQNSQLRFNSTTGKMEFYNSTSANWVDVAYLNVQATGGNSVYEVDTEGTTYRVHVFTTVGNSTFTVTAGGRIEYLIVAGGGAGSGNFYDDGAGGGAGGLITGFVNVTPQAYTITVGGGGTLSGGGAGNNGGNSVAFGLTALGGGGGAGHRGVGIAGGSGGGGAGYYGNDGLNYAGGAGQQPGSGSGGFGNAGGGYTTGEIGGTFLYPNSSGGGGAGAIGGRPITSAGGGGGHGGPGLPFNISGRNTFYAGGGGGLSLGVGGIGGGASASSGRGGTAALPGTPGTGGGGGGGRDQPGEPGLPSIGGSGIVIVRYPVRQKALLTSIREINDNSLICSFDFSNQLTYPGVGDLAYDASGNPTTGILINGPTTRDFRTHRSSFRFNGSNQHIRLDNFRNRPTGTGLTCEAWVFPNRAVITSTRRGAIWSNSASTYLGIFDSNDGGANHGLHWALQTTASRSGSNNGSIPNNQWSHIVGTYDGSRTRGYINGTLVYDVAQTGNVTDGTWYLGTYGQGINDGTHNWEGNIADAKLYNRALTQQEIQNNFNVNRWRFGI